MTKIKYTKEECVNIILSLQKEIGEKEVISYTLLKKRGLECTIHNYWKDIYELRKDLRLYEPSEYHRYNDDEIIQSYKEYAQSIGKFPEYGEAKQIWKEYHLPNPETVHRRFKSWALFSYKCGYIPNYYILKDGELKKEYEDPIFLKQLVLDIYSKINKRPKLKEVNDYYGVQLTRVFKKYFGSYNNCLKELGIIPRSREYTDEELDEAFYRFINTYHRTPSCNDFVGREGYPSFTLYQYRFGSWVKACMHYGAKPNCKKPEYYLEDGERCDSRFEVDVSNWLRKNNIIYKRNIPYTDIDSRYSGKMNCDYYVISNHGIPWYIEIVGFINGKSESRYSSEEQLYLTKLRYKEKLLERNNIKYKFIFRKELETKTLDDLMSFLL